LEPAIIERTEPTRPYLLSLSPRHPVWGLRTRTRGDCGTSRLRRPRRRGAWRQEPINRCLAGTNL